MCAMKSGCSSSESSSLLKFEVPYLGPPRLLMLVVL